MTYNEKKSLYESIMKDVAKTVKRKINESEDILSHGNDDLFGFRDGIREESYIIIGGTDYISDNKSMRDYYFQANVSSIRSSLKVSTICTDGKNIYYNPDFMSKLSDVEQAFVILHCCAHIIMSHHSNNFEENIELDKKVNRYLEERWPEFRGLTKKLNGFI